MESNECPSSKVYDIEKSLYEPINFIKSFELELTQNGPKETVDVLICLYNCDGYDGQPAPSLYPFNPQWSSSPPMVTANCYHCSLCQCTHQKLQLIVRLQFRNIAHMFPLHPRMAWSYDVEACVTARLPNIALPSGVPYHVHDTHRMSCRRSGATLDFPPIEFAFHGVDSGNYDFRIVHVSLKMSKTKVIYVDANQAWQTVDDELGPCYKDLYPKILTYNPWCGSNVIIHVGPAVLKAHKKVLSAKSYRLRKFFHTNPRATEIHFLNVEVDVVRAMLEFFYTNQLDCLGLVASSSRLCELLVRLYHYAKSYDLEKLGIACLDHVPFAVTPETAPIFFEFAACNNLPYLHQALKQYIYAINNNQISTNLPQPAGVYWQ